MIKDPYINPDIALRIEAELAMIEQQEKVRILLAVESGSRAWRFPSCDSDYDVRFLYVRPVTDYLTIAKRRDVIERPVDAVFDVNGWDVSKALALALCSNAVLLEWLDSPVRYRALPDWPARIQAFAQETASPRALAHHYASLGQRRLKEIEVSTEVKLKTLCYALRAALALQWVQTHKMPPPMALPALLAGLVVCDAVREEIDKLVVHKANTTEQEVVAPSEELRQFLRITLRFSPGLAEIYPPDEASAQGDRLFQEMIYGIDARAWPSHQLHARTSKNL